VIQKLEPLYDLYKKHHLYEKMVRELELESGSLSSFTDELDESE